MFVAMIGMLILFAVSKGGNISSKFNVLVYRSCNVKDAPAYGCKYRPYVTPPPKADCKDYGKQLGCLSRHEVGTTRLSRSVCFVPHRGVELLDVVLTTNDISLTADLYAIQWQDWEQAVPGEGPHAAVSSPLDRLRKLHAFVLVEFVPPLEQLKPSIEVVVLDVLA
eukprot:150414-Prorocentrum_minimum.AAC.2